MNLNAAAHQRPVPLTLPAVQSRRLSGPRAWLTDAVCETADRIPQPESASYEGGLRTYISEIAMANDYVSTKLVAAGTSLFAIAVLAVGWSTVDSWANQRKTEGQQSPAVKMARVHQAVGVTLFFV